MLTNATPATIKARIRLALQLYLHLLGHIKLTEVSKVKWGPLSYLAWGTAVQSLTPSSDAGLPSTHFFCCYPPEYTSFASVCALCSHTTEKLVKLCNIALLMAWSKHGLLDKRPIPVNTKTLFLLLCRNTLLYLGPHGFLKRHYTRLEKLYLSLNWRNVTL